MRTFAAFMILGWLGVVAVANAEPVPRWSVGLHRMVFADPLDARPLPAADGTLEFDVRSPRVGSGQDTGIDL
ncbi:hypothetical protein [Pseudomonas sp. UM16]|uniref:hypothetical protein n=1 Tax=Pseudomonas sp. UM16 TaxID=3158962 RepID=UPI00398F9A89